jgi:hypothetical protein
MTLGGVDAGSLDVVGDPEEEVGMVMHGLPFVLLAVMVGGDG